MRTSYSTPFTLGEFTAEDAPDIVECLSDRWIADVTLRIPYPYSLVDAERFLDHVAQQTAKQGQQVHWAIRNPRGRVIGALGLEGFEIGRSHRAEIGYWLAAPYRGQGIVTAAVEMTCRHAFENLGLVKITAHVFAFNTASARVLEKCGFVQEGLLKQHYLKNGEFHDALAYGLLKQASISSATSANRRKP